MVGGNSLLALALKTALLTGDTNRLALGFFSRWQLRRVSQVHDKPSSLFCCVGETCQSFFLGGGGGGGQFFFSANCKDFPGNVSHTKPAGLSEQQRVAKGAGEIVSDAFARGCWSLSPIGQIDGWRRSM